MFFMVFTSGLLGAFPLQLIYGYNYPNGGNLNPESLLVNWVKKKI